jgi:peptidoglycan/LPS O-acetylase OafA/YrhL
VTAPRALRALLGAGGVALAASLFLPFFRGVSGWEHWAWVDVVFAVLAAGLVAAAVAGVRRRSVLVAIALLCAVGVSVVIGHGFDGDGEALAGPYVALGGLAAGCAGAVGSVASRHRPSTSSPIGRRSRRSP